MNETRRAVLTELADGPRSGTDLADELDVSRAAVWKHVEALREAGFEIESGQSGYELSGIPEYGAEAVAFGLEAPFDVRFEEHPASTNDVARDLAADGAEDVVVLADEQTGGRGRLDREWASPSGGVWLSMLLRPDRPPSTVPLYTLAAAVAVTEAAREVGVDAGIKWPNDVLVSERQRAKEGSSDERSESDGVFVSERQRAKEGSSDERSESDGVFVSERQRAKEGSSDERSESDGVSASEASGGSSDLGSDDALVGDREAKLAGILTEMEGEADRVAWVVVGIGVNANVDAAQLPEGATSLRAEVGDVDRRLFVQRLLERFHELRSDPDAILPAWREYSLTLGRRVRVETPAETVVGTATSIEHPGALVLETDDGTRRIHAGDCEHLRPA